MIEASEQVLMGTGRPEIKRTLTSGHTSSYMRLRNVSNLTLTEDVLFSYWEIAANTLIKSAFKNFYSRLYAIL